jgi:hypothetical protein
VDDVLEQMRLHQEEEEEIMRRARRQHAARDTGEEGPPEPFVRK